MSKFHINKHGVPAPCKAKPGNCPLGGDDTHFETEAEAQAYIDNKSANEFGHLPVVDVSRRLDTDEERHDFKQEKAKQMLKEHFDKHMADGFDEVMEDEETYGNIKTYTSKENAGEEELDSHMFEQDIIGVSDYGMDDDEEEFLRRGRVSDVVQAIKYMNRSKGETEDEVMAEVSEKMTNDFISERFKKDEGRQHSSLPTEGETMAKLFEYGAKHDKLYRVYNEYGVNKYGPSGREIAENELIERFKNDVADERDLHVLDDTGHPKEVMGAIEEYYHSPMYNMKGEEERISKISDRIKDWAKGL